MYLAAGLEQATVQAVTTLALIDLSLLDTIQKRAPELTPRDGHWGKAFPGTHPALEAEGRMLLISPAELWGLWGRWNTALFEARQGDEGEEPAITLLRRVDRWNPTDLTLFCCDWMQRNIEGYCGDALQGDERPVRAIEAVRGYLQGTVTAEALEEARAAAAEMMEAIPDMRKSVFEATDEEARLVRARKVASGAVMLATRDGARQAPGTRARRGMDAVFQACCYNKGGWIAAKIIGRRREAELLAFLGVGTKKERAAIEAGKTLTGEPVGSRYAWSTETGETVDAARFEAE